MNHQTRFQALNVQTTHFRTTFTCMCIRGRKYLDNGTKFEVWQNRRAVRSLILFVNLASRPNVCVSTTRCFFFLPQIVEHVRTIFWLHIMRMRLAEVHIYGKLRLLLSLWMKQRVSISCLVTHPMFQLPIVCVPDGDKGKISHTYYIFLPSYCFVNLHKWFILTLVLNHGLFAGAKKRDEYFF